MTDTRQNYRIVLKSGVTQELYSAMISGVAADMTHFDAGMDGEIKLTVRSDEIALILAVPAKNKIPPLA